jgi:cell fate (sporulation/competence/biofilm development) regulator YlbF (YheA/YmcA/DUF963 family)
MQPIKHHNQKERMMNLQTPITNNTESKIEPKNAARELGELLLHTHEYQAFLAALNVVNNDPAVREISTKMRSHQNALRWSPSNSAEHQTALTRLELELEELPTVQNYRRAEEAVCRLFAEVDTIISETAGAPFAAYARRSGCGCGS